LYTYRLSSVFQEEGYSGKRLLSWINRQPRERLYGEWGLLVSMAMFLAFMCQYSATDISLSEMQKMKFDAAIFVGILTILEIFFQLQIKGIRDDFSRAPRTHRLFAATLIAPFLLLSFHIFAVVAGYIDQLWQGVWVLSYWGIIFGGAM